MGPTFWLTIAKQKDDQLILTLYDHQSLEDVAPLDQITRPWPIGGDDKKNFIRSAMSLVESPTRVGWDVRAVYGNVLAYWLFGTDLQAPTEEQIHQSLLPEPPIVPLNRIGCHLKNAAKDAPTSSRIRLFVCLEQTLFNFPEMLKGIFFQSLSENQLVPLDAVRSVWNHQTASAQTPVLSKQPVAERLRVLLVQSNPPEGGRKPHLPHLEDDFVALKETFNSLAGHQLLDLIAIRQPSIEELKQRLQPGDPKANPHVFIFLGHGYDESSDKSAGAGLVCVDKDGVERKWNYGRLQAILLEQEDAANLRLVVLLACESFVAAPALLSLGVPAVVAMQRYLRHDFPSPGVVPFAKPLLEALANFIPITTAFQRGVEKLQGIAWQDEALRKAKEKPKKGDEQFTEEDVQRSLKAAAVMPTLWLAGPEDRLFAPEDERLKTLYKDALLSKIMLCEWVGHDKVTIDQVFVDMLLRNLSTDGKSTCDKILELLSSGQAVALEGPEWSGKSTVAHWVVSQVFESKKIPIFVDGRAMKTEKQTLEQWVLASCRDRLGLMVYPEATRLIMQAYQTGNAVLVIDDGDPHWLTEPPHALKQQLCEEQQATNTSPIIVTVSEGAHASDANWTRLRIEPLHPNGQAELVKAYGAAVNAEPAAEDFGLRLSEAAQRPEELTALTGRPGFLVDMLAQFLRQEVLLTNEADLLARRQQHHWNKPIANVPLQPDEPVYKQRLLDALGFHLYCCHKSTTPISKQFMHTILEQQQIYASEQAGELLQEFVEARPFLRCTATQVNDHVAPILTWTFRSPEWLRFSAANQIASLVNERDEIVLAWLSGGLSPTCRLCQTKLAPFIELVDPARGDEVQQAVASALAEDLPAWRRADPWDCEQVLELRRVLVRTLRLPSAAIA